MSRQYFLRSLLLVGLVVAAVIVGFGWLTGRAAAQGNRTYPVVVALTNFGGAVAVQNVLQRGTGPFPTTGNATPLYLTAQLVAAVNTQPPVTSEALALASWLIIPAASSQGFLESPPCTLTEAGTMLVCKLIPTGATWVAGGPVHFRLRLESTSGHVGTAILNFPIN